MAGGLLARPLCLAVVGFAALGLASCSETDDIERVSWSDYEVVDDTTLRITVPGTEYRSDSCFAFEPEVDAEPDEVRVTLAYRRVEEMCTAEGVIGPIALDVDLPEPLAGRPVVDGST